MNRDAFTKDFIRLLEKEIPDSLPEEATEIFFLKAAKAYIDRRVDHVIAGAENIKGKQDE